MCSFSLLFVVLILTLNVRGQVMPLASSCPDPQDIEPCVCSGDDSDLDLDCSLVADEDQLSAVFQANFPSPAFRRFTITDNDNIQVLRTGVLGNVTFSEVWITSGQLKEVQEGALPTSSLRLVLNFNNITSFPFASLSSFSPGLVSLDLRSNDLQEFPSALASNTLQTLYLSHNPLGSLPATAFVNTPALVDLHLSNTQIPEVLAGTFTPLTQLVNLGLGNNQLRRLEEGAIEATPSLALLDVGYNALTYVDPAAFSGFTNGWLYIHHNGITTLEESVWQTVIQGPDAYLDPYGNPLHCGCDVAWLVRDQTLMDKIDIYSTCADGRPLLSLDPAEFEAC